MDVAAVDRRPDAGWLLRSLGFAAVWVVSGYYAVWLVPSLVRSGFLGIDSHAYWLTGHTDGSLYTRPAQSIDAFLYSPVFAFAIRPLTLLPYSVFGILWAAGILGAYLWLLKGSPLGWTVPLFVVACLPDLILGNVFAFLAVALVLACGPQHRPRLAAAAAVPLLTKITPGITCLWFLLRLDLRRFTIAAASTLGVVLLTFAVAPQLWLDYADFLLSGDSHATLGFPVRVGLAIVVCVVAARSGRVELLAVAAVLSLPVIGGPSALGLLAAVPRLRSERLVAPPDPARSYLRIGSTEA
jgi:Glycosyltransferase family 87